jgi:hypothetical protein
VSRRERTGRRLIPGISYLGRLTIPYRVKPSTSAWPVTSKPRFE